MAHIHTYTLQWKGNSGASATGTITLDTDLVPQNGPGSGPIPMSAIQALSITVSGARAGNGPYGKADFSELIFYSMAPLNFSQPLIGQAMGNGLPPFGTPGALGNAGDFNLKGMGMAPDGVQAFEMATNGKQDPSDLLQLTKITPNHH